MKKIIIAIVFGLVTLLFLAQHANAFSWDFHSYVLNAEYWLQDGSYFEPLRPPLMPLMIGALETIGNRAFAEYGFIIIASTLFLIGTMKLAEALKFDKLTFYMLSCSFYVLTVGLYNGTELLSYAFMELFLAALITNRFSGIYLGLFALSRYAGLAFAPLLLFHNSWKDRILNASAFGAVLLPWLAHNFVTYGNWFTSIADQYANNVFFREYIHTAINTGHFMSVAGILTPLILIGTYGIIQKCVRKEEIRTTAIIGIVAALTIYSYVMTPIKSNRYLFNLALPCAFLAYHGFMRVRTWIVNKWSKRIATIALAIIFLMGFFMAANTIMEKPGTQRIYNMAITDLYKHDLQNCSIMSNAWVELNYMGRTTMDFPRKELVNKSIQEGEILVMFPHIGEPAYSRDKEFLHSFNVISEQEKYTIIGNGCKDIRKNDKTYVKKLADTVEAMNGYRTEERPCYLLFKNAIMQKMCEWVNLKKST